MNRLYLFIISLFFASTLFAASPKREVRAVWLTTIGGIDWPHSYAQSETSIRKQQAELTRLLDKYQQAGINTVLIQTRVRGTVIYPSAIEPWDGCLSGFPGKSPGYDALRFVIQECHKRGMELHAWVVTIPVGKWNKLGCSSLRKRYPSLIRKIDADGYMNPEDPRTATYLADLCEEITRNYDIDGIHLDYIRYPETWKIKVNREQGRKYITGIVRAIHDRVKALKPWVKMSCSPVGKYDDLARYWSHGWNAYSTVCQDAQGWLASGLMDALFPMMYFRGDQFFPFAVDWAEQSHGRIVAPGLGIYFLDPREGNWKIGDVTQEMEVLRQYGLGHTFFRGKFLTDNCQGIYEFTKRFDHTPALVPAMTWEQAAQPSAPTAIRLKDNQLSWQGATPYYNIYSSRTFPVDISDPENLIVARMPAHRDGSTYEGGATRLAVAVPADEGRFFAVTAMDRYGNESGAAQSHAATAPSLPSLLPCDGHEVQLPTMPSTLDAPMVVVETLQGSLIATMPYPTHRLLDVSSLRPGMYVVRSLSRKGITHRLGLFQLIRE